MFICIDGHLGVLSIEYLDLEVNSVMIQSHIPNSIPNAQVGRALSAQGSES